MAEAIEAVEDDLRFLAAVRGAPVEAAACGSLWAAVLHQALKDIHDAQTGGPMRSAPYGGGRQPRPEWVGSRDFHMTCALAGLDGTAVAEAFRAGRFVPQAQVGHNGGRD